jgi:bacterioferritin (cytochrome b1)
MKPKENTTGLQNRKLIKELQKAYAGELGAYQAYNHHFLATGDPAIRKIQEDEEEHVYQLEDMLGHLHASSSAWRNVLIKYIGFVLGLLCYVCTERACARGALLLEKIGVTKYKEISKLARKQGRLQMATKLSEMGKTEERHERYLRARLVQFPVNRGCL